MEKGYSALVVVIIIILAVVLLVRWFKNQNKKKVILFQEWGAKMGFQHSQTKKFFYRFNYLEGEVNGNKVRIYESLSGSGDNQTVVCNFTITPSPFNFSFRIGKEHFFSKTGKLLGMKDVEVGDEKFDKIFLLKSKEESQLKSVINYKIQSELMQIKDALKSTIQVDENFIKYSTIQPVMRERQLEEFERVFNFALLLVKENKR